MLCVQRQHGVVEVCPTLLHSQWWEPNLRFSGLESVAQFTWTTTHILASCTTTSTGGYILHLFGGSSTEHCSDKMTHKGPEQNSTA